MNIAVGIFATAMICGEVGTAVLISLVAVVGFALGRTGGLTLAVTFLAWAGVATTVPGFARVLWGVISAPAKRG